MCNPLFSFWNPETTVTSFHSLAPKTSQRARTRRPRPKHKTTPSPEIPQPKPGK